MENKYNILFSNKEIEANSNRLTNQLWKLIPMREKEEDWKKQIDTIVIEIIGLKEIFPKFLPYLQLLSKLEGLRVEDVNFELYRKTIFECISLLPRS